MRDGLIIFAKPPVAGRVKTRLQSMLLPEEVADLIAFIVSEQAAYITGQTISINGGMA